MGIGAGGSITQKIYPDPHGIDVWDAGSQTTLQIHLVNSLDYRDLTGREPPPTPIDAAAYTAAGFPWFALYEESQGDVEAPATLTGIPKTTDDPHERGIEIDPRQVRPTGE
jgi:hypothetical protein